MLLWIALLPAHAGFAVHQRHGGTTGNNSKRVVDVLAFVLFFWVDTLVKSRITWRYFNIPNMGSLKRFLPQRWLPFIEIQIAAVFSTFRCVLGLNFLATGLLPLPSWFEGLSITLDLLCLGDGWWYRFIWHGFPVPLQTASHFVIQQLWKGKLRVKQHAIPPYWAASLWGKSFLQVCGWLALLLGVFGVFHDWLLSLDSQLTYQS